MSINLRLPKGADIDVCRAAVRAQSLHTTLAMAWGTQLRTGARDPIWLVEAVREINDLIDALGLKAEIALVDPVAQKPVETDAVTNIFERLSRRAIERNTIDGQVLR